MKDTGIIRRVDELGRLVIPKEIRKHLRIRDGDSVEIFINEQGQIILKKHALFRGLEQSVESLARTLAEETANTVLVSDISNIVTGSGKNAKDLIGNEITGKFIQQVEQRRPLNITSRDICVKCAFDYPSHVYPLIVHGDLYGALIIIEDSRQMVGTDLNLVMAMNKYLVRQLEV